MCSVRMRKLLLSGVAALALLLTGATTLSAQTWKTPAQAQVILKTEYLAMEETSIDLQETDQVAYERLLAKMKLYSDVHYETRQTSSVEDAVDAAIAKHVSEQTTFGTDASAASGGATSIRGLYSELKTLLTD